MNKGFANSGSDRPREVPIMKWGEHGEVLKKDKTFPAHCKLIERG